jgi:PAS domain S-box-containing protein
MSAPKGSPAEVQMPGPDSFRLLVEGVSDYAIFMLDPAGHIMSWNAGAERLKQYRRDEIVGQHFSIFYPPEDLAWDKPAFELVEALRVGRFEDEGWRLRKDGTRFWANVVITALWDETRTLRGFAKVTRDLTERRKAEEELRQSELRLRLLIDSIKDYAVFMLDTDGKIATWNPGAERIKGYRADEILGRSFTLFYPEEDVRSGKCEAELATAASVGRFEEEGWRIRKDGTRFWSNVVINAVRDEAGTLIGFAKVTRDLTDRKRAQEEQAARLIAEQANLAKDQFLAMLGHELRNPLAPITTALQILKLRSGDSQSHEMEIIERQVNHMTGLIDDLLDMARVTKGMLRLTRKRCDLRQIIASAIESVSPLLEQKRHVFAFDIAPGALVVDADELRLNQIFANLLTNAAKYTDDGGHLAVKARSSGSEVIVEVSDDGVGIAPELLTKVFDIFVQADQGADRAAGGLGIGLSLVRTLVSLHGGSVTAESPGIGGGSTFTVRLPAAAAEAPSAVATTTRESPTPPALLHSQRILLVDDNRDALEMLSEYLAHFGHDVRTAADGPQAIQLVREFTPDIAILDIGLPVMDGYELARHLQRELGEARPRFIALTGYGQDRDRARSAEAGFTDHFIKPVDVQALIKIVGAGK